MGQVFNYREVLKEITDPMASHKDILIIGGGVIGVCAAYYLIKSGRQVTLLESGDICSGASYGNAGFILYSHIIPLAAPGVLGQGLKWLFDSTSPFYIKPRLSLELASWLWRFRSACTEKNMKRSMGLLFDMSAESRKLYNELIHEQGVECGYRQEGYIKICHTEKGFDSAKREADLMNEFHVPVKVLEPAAVCDMEPAVLPQIAGGLYFPDDAHLIPDEFVLGLAETAQMMGVDIQPRTEVLGFDVSGSTISSVRTTRGNFAADHIVLAGGAWSPILVRDLQLKLPIQGAKGYSVTYACDNHGAEDIPALPLLLKESAVAVTPMDGRIRFAGTLELAGMDLSINEKRIKAFLNNAGKYLRVPKDLPLIEIWRGLRPCTPDGLPIIGRTKRYNNLILATGHATVGMGLGPVTGKLVAQMISHTLPDIDITPFGIERF